MTVVFFILISLLLVAGFLTGRPPVGLGALTRESFAPGGLGGILGSMLIVMFSYSGFEIIALAASDVKEPRRTIPRAIRLTVFGLVSLFILYVMFLLPLIPTASLDENTSAIVASLGLFGIGWAGTVITCGGDLGYLLDDARHHLRPGPDDALPGRGGSRSALAEGKNRRPQAWHRHHRRRDAAVAGAWAPVSERLSVPAELRRLRDSADLAPP